MTATSWTHERAKLASLHRHSPGDEHAIDEARRALRLARLEQAIRDAVAAAPPLDDEQRTQLAAILRGSGQAHA
jgi:hypothetical protein